MPARKKSPTRGMLILSGLLAAIQQRKSELSQGARDLPVLTGLTQKDFSNRQENVLQAATEILVNSGRVYQHHQDVVMETGSATKKSLVPLVEGYCVLRHAKSMLTNLFVCRHKESEFPPPDWFVQQLLLCEPVKNRLPVIHTYRTRPIYDDSFTLCGPGWHPEHGVLIHGEVIEPCLTGFNPTAVNPLDRLPPHLRALLRDFPFKDPADLTNTLGMMLTGLLSNHFILNQKALWLVDGNQPGLGKTLVVQIVGTVLDGKDPNRIPYTSEDQEFRNQTCATLRERTQSVLLYDNAKAGKGEELSSPFLESSSTSPEISIRILGHSTNYVQPNDVLWAVTMNNTRACQDLISRSCVTRLELEGRTENRNYTLRDPLEYAKKHRQEILGELAGMVERWKQAGRPLSNHQHRQHEWARTIGGILKVNGLPEFLGNADTAAASFSSELEKLTELAESIVNNHLRSISGEQRLQVAETSKAKCKDWVPFFTQVDQAPNSTAHNQRAQTSQLGKFLTPLVGRSVTIQLGDHGCQATLRSMEVRSNRKEYWFELHWEVPVETDRQVDNTSTGGSTASVSAAPPACQQPSINGNQENWD